MKYHTDILELLVQMESAAPKGTKKPQPGKKAKYKDPVHVKGIGIMERGQAEKHYPGMNYSETKLYKEANEGVDHVTMTVPLLIRCLEWAHEDAKTDVEIHKFVERIIAKGGVLDTADYEGFLK